MKINDMEPALPTFDEAKDFMHNAAANQQRIPALRVLAECLLRKYYPERVCPMHVTGLVFSLQTYLFGQECIVKNKIITFLIYIIILILYVFISFFLYGSQTGNWLITLIGSALGAAHLLYRRNKSPFSSYDYVLGLNGCYYERDRVRQRELFLKFTFAHQLLGNIDLHRNMTAVTSCSDLLPLVNRSIKDNIEWYFRERGAHRNHEVYKQRIKETYQLALYFEIYCSRRNWTPETFFDELYVVYRDKRDLDEFIQKHVSPLTKATTVPA